jgi:riboflavin synthase
VTKFAVATYHDMPNTYSRGTGLKQTTEAESGKMFSGLVEHLGQVVGLIDDAPGKRIVVDAGLVAEDAQIGDSIANNGCCLTVVDVHGSRLSFDAGPETLAKTNLGQLEIGSPVNLERSLRLSDRLGGHLVTGHVDAIGQLVKRVDENEWSTIWFSAPRPQMLQMASKGSITVDGVSLTLVDVTDDTFSVALIPHTLKVTTLGEKKIGDSVNLETDLLAKYVARQLAGHLHKDS